MATFSYRGVGSGGKPLSGRLDAADRKQALARLRQQGVRPLEVAQVSAAAPEAAGSAASRQGGVGGGKRGLAYVTRGHGARGGAGSGNPPSGGSPAGAATAQSAMLADAGFDGGLAVTAEAAGGAKRRGLFSGLGSGRAL